MASRPRSPSHGVRPRGERADPASRYVEDPNDPRVQERNRNRTLLGQLNDNYHKFVADCESQLGSMRTEFAGMRGTWMQEHEQVKSELQQVMQEKVALKSDVHHMRSEMDRMRQECQQLINHTREQASQQSSMKREFEEMRKELQRAREQANQQGSMKRDFEEMRREFQSQAREQGSAQVSMKRDFQEMKREFQREIQQVTGKMGDFDRQAVELKRGLQSKDEIVRLESRTGLVIHDLQKLTRQLWDRGVLAPPKPEEPPEEDKCPVGVLELDEDVFTARLLLKLGFMRAEAESRQGADSSDEDSDREAMMELSHFENVQGLMLPEVEKGEKGYLAATKGWLSICAVTTLVQWLILAVMLSHGLHSDECFHRPPTPFKWWLLHLSKALAMAMTGVLMGKEIMGILNYYLVSELLEPRRSAEVVATAMAQGGLTILLVAANVFIFMGLTNPVDVWTNMAALGFIASLDAEVLAAAKGGMLGHDIAKSLTPLNYQLSFMSYYPAWFGYVRGLAVVCVTCFIACFSAVVFVMPDPVCEAD